MRADDRRGRISRGTMEPPRWKTGILSRGAGTVWRLGPVRFSPDSTSYHGCDSPGKYTSTDVASAAVTGFTSRSEPTSHWSSMAKTSCNNAKVTKVICGARITHPILWVLHPQRPHRGQA
jgi:hypothetical protein